MSCFDPEPGALGRGPSLAELVPEVADPTRSRSHRGLSFGSALAARAPNEAPLAKRIAERQNPDGGGSQTPTMPGHAWATGQALYALGHAGASPNEAAIVRGQSFLAKTQLPDGSGLVGQ